MSITKLKTKNLTSYICLKCDKKSLTNSSLCKSHTLEEFERIFKVK